MRIYSAITIAFLSVLIMASPACGGERQLVNTPTVVVEAVVFDVPTSETTAPVKIDVKPSHTIEPPKPEAITHYISTPTPPKAPPDVEPTKSDSVPSLISSATRIPVPTVLNPAPDVIGTRNKTVLDLPTFTPTPIVSSNTADNASGSSVKTARELLPRSEYSGAGWNPLSSAEDYRRVTPPDERAIALAYDPVGEKVKVSGGPGAVPSGSVVMVANLELGEIELAVADLAGEFEIDISARPGTHILIKQDPTGNQISLNRELDTEGPNSPGIILTIPPLGTKDGHSFAGGARVSGKEIPWVLEGTISKIDFQEGDKANISGQLSILTNVPMPDDIRFSFAGQMLGDENGVQMGPGGIFASNILTQTGLPIVPGISNPDFFYNDCNDHPLKWRQEKDKSVSDFSCNLVIETPGGTPEGTYILWVTLHFPEEFSFDVDGGDEDRKLFKFGSSNTENMVAIAAATVGSPKPVKLATTLLADLLQEGTRGGIWPQVNESQFAISPLTITNHDPIIPRLDPHGDTLTHRLDPFVPLMGMTDRSPPAIPFLEFDFSQSEIRIDIERPDGKTDVLGPTPFGAYGVKTPLLPHSSPIAGGGGHIGEIPQLLGTGDELAYQFPFDGEYRLNLSGHLSDKNGLIFEITGSYDLTVANSLDIETLLLPGTPFEVGDALPVGLHVFPGVPAVVYFTVTHVGADNVITLRQYEGAANESGYWDGEGEYFAFENAGEYKVDVEARYTGANGALWVGRMVYGSGIATPNGPVIAHGLRGPDNIGSIPPPWGFGSDFEAGGHHQFPFFTGDILWGIEGPEPNRDEMGPGDSVNTGMSFQAVDADHSLVARAIKQVPPGQVTGDITALLQAGQIPHATFMELNPDGSSKSASEGFRPEQLNLRSYAYSSAQRPGVRVREVIQGSHIGKGYWRFNDAYHMQSGNGSSEGDLPGEFKFLYGATVIRDTKLKEGIFAIYGSGWVLAENDDPMGSRFMPPFQGNAGGPNGGPLFNLHGRDIDMFFVPLGIRPGAILEVGDVFRMAGPIMPTLPSKVEYSVIAPDGDVRTFTGRANAAGYFYDTSADFELDQPGLWTVELTIIHDGMTSAGHVQEPYPSGGPLTPDGRTFHFVVIDGKTEQLPIATNLAYLKPERWDRDIQNAYFASLLPSKWAGDTARAIVTMPGIVLVDKVLPVSNGVIEWQLVGSDLNEIAGNFNGKNGLADTITVTFFAEDLSNIQTAGTIVTHGARVPNASPAPSIPLRSDRPTGFAACIEGETELFTSDFELGAQEWGFSDESSWSVVQSEDSKVLQGMGHAHASAGDNWDEVIWRMRVKLISGGLHINFHTGGEGNRYSVSFWEQTTGLTVGNESTSVEVGSYHSPQEWHVVEIGIQNDQLFIGSDGILEIEQYQPNPLPPGGIDFEVLPDSVAMFDNIVICKPE